jgi:hypothetical protein
MLVWPAAARDGATAVDAELVLAVDISYSMDREEQELQRDGYVQALTSPQFLNALKSNEHGRIAIAYLQWASYFDQDILIDWTIIDGPASAEAFAQRLKSAPYRRAQRTSISGAIDRAVKLFDGNGFRSDRLVIDVSGDGENSSGRPARVARDAAVAQGIVINGLPILAFEPFLDQHYEREVIGGEGSFMIVAKNFETFGDAVLRKLIAEIADLR